MADVRIYHNPKCSTSRFAVESADALGVDAALELYLVTPPDRQELLDLIDILEDPVADLVRKDPYFKELGLSADDYTTVDAVVGLIVEHPRLLQRPILVRDGRAIIGRPKERIAEFLAD